jgi:hypothetical protein
MDIHGINEARAVEDYFGEILADAINKGDPKFKKLFLE